jgi:hypothetical protein
MDRYSTLFHRNLGPFRICNGRDQTFHESDPFLLLDRINHWALVEICPSGTHPIPLLEIIDKTDGAIEIWDFF